MPLQHKHWQTAPPSYAIGLYQPAGQAAQAVAGACLEFPFSSFSAAGRLVGVRNGEEGGVDWGMTRPKTDERARKGRLSDFFFDFPLHFLCVVTYLLFRHACYARSETNVWVQEGGCKKKKKKKKGAENFSSVCRRIFSSRNHFTPTLNHNNWLQSRCNTGWKINSILWSLSSSRFFRLKILINRTVTWNKFWYARP